MDDSHGYCVRNAARPFNLLGGQLHLPNERATESDILKLCACVWTQKKVFIIMICDRTIRNVAVFFFFFVQCRSFVLNDKNVILVRVKN